MLRLFLSKRKRREAESRAPEYAEYYILIHGAAAEGEIKRRLTQHGAFSYHRLLYALALKEVRRRTALAAIPIRRRAG